MKQLDGKNLVFEEKYLSHFVTNKTKIFFELLGIIEVTTVIL